LRYYKKNIAVLIFALSQEEEIKRKPFLRNTSLQQDLTSHTLTEVKKTGLDYYVYDEQHQVGTSFGERFTNAITDIYNKGYEAVISVGNDTPNLTNIHVHKAIEFLQKGQSVIGPSFDGGFYLMGLHKETFNRQEFSEFSWSTATIRKELYAYLESNSESFCQLDFLHDLDQVSDIIEVYKALPFSLQKIRRKLQQILQQGKTIWINLSISLGSIFLKIYYNKGSPAFV